MRSLLPLAFGLAVLASPAAAQVNFKTSVKGYHYFHRTRATMAEHDAAVRDCALVVAGLPLDAGDRRRSLFSPQDIPQEALLDNIHVRNAVAGNLENCMVARGWDVMQLDPDKGAALAASPPQAQHETLAGWVGAEQPEGRLARRFANEMTDPTTVWDGRSWGSEQPSLSVTSQGPFRSVPQVVRQYKLPKDFAAKPLKAKAVAALPADAAIVVVRVTGSRRRWGGGGGQPVFTRVGSDMIKPAWADGRAASFLVDWIGQDRTLVFSVPPGRWRLAGLTSGYGFTSLCLGAPAFEIAPGQALFAGTITQGGPGQFVPDMDIGPLRNILSDMPDLVDRLEPATWVNGNRFRCEGDFAYALEIPGAPFEDGYVGMSKAAIAP